MLQKNSVFIIGLFLIFLLQSTTLFSQTHTAKTETVNANCKGFYEYLPLNYQTTTTKFPLLIYCSGYGERGNGSSADLTRLLSFGVPYYINNGQFPKTVTVNGNTTSFIVISPQFIDIPSPTDISNLIDFIIAKNYRVDQSRIYLTGFSIGGNAAWKYPNTSIDFAKRLAAIVPVAAYNYPYVDSGAKYIAAANLPVWALHSDADQQAPILWSQSFVNKVNSFNPPNLAKLTRIAGQTHDQTGIYAYNPSYRPEGKNIYEWVLQFSRNQAPNAIAEIDKVISLPLNSTTLIGSASFDAESDQIFFSWSKIKGPNKYTLFDSTNANAVVSDLVAGIYGFRLRTSDANGMFDDDTLNVTVLNPFSNILPVANAGKDTTIYYPYSNFLLNASASYDNGGVIEKYEWKQLSGSVQLQITSPNSFITDLANIMPGTYSFELKITDNESGIAKDTINIFAINLNPNLFPVANAGSDITAVVSTDSIFLNATSSYDPDGNIIGYKWRVIGNSGPVISNTNSSSTWLKSLVAGVHKIELTVTDNNNATSLDTVSISIITSPAQDKKNVQVNIFGGTNPYNNALWNNWNCSTVGSASPVFLYTDGSSSGITAILSASAAISDNGNSYGGTMCPPEVLRYVSYNTSNRTLTIRNLNKQLLYSVDLYASRLRTDNQQTTYTVVGQTITISTDNNKNNIASFSNLTPNANNEIIISIGRSASSTYNYLNGFKLSVSSTAVNQIPVVNAGTSQQIELPTSQAVLSGTATDTDGTIIQVAWTKISGPNVIIESPATVSSRISALEKGDYIFRLTATDNAGATSFSEVGVSVTNGPPPVVSAGSDQTITLPKNTVSVSGQANSNVGILSVEWSQVSGPSLSQILTPMNVQTQISNLIEGIYQFKFKAVNNNGVSAEDLVNIQVNSQAFAPPGVIDSINCGLITKVVIIGSSTAAGTGASPIDSAWVNKFTKYLISKNPSNQIVNLAAGALTTYETLCPTGFIPPANRPAPVSYRNITAALSLNPTAIIINLPSNDIALGYSLQEQYDNFERAIALASASKVPVWVSTSQPRNLSVSERDQLKTLRDWINNRFGKFSIDFWSVIAQADGTINPTYSSGDGIHLNNLGHHLLYTRTVGEQILDYLCSQNNLIPIVSVGKDQTIRLPLNAVNLVGVASDADGSISQYGWSKVSGGSAIISTPSTSSTTITGLTTGNYVFRLTVTDNKGASVFDDITITVLPLLLNSVQAGTDQTIQLPTNSVSLSGTNGNEYGTNAILWTQLSGPSIADIQSPISLGTSVNNLVNGIYVFALSVTNLENNTSTDQVSVTVNALPNQLPFVSIGDDQSIRLPLNSISLLGVASDPDGSISQYLWTKISGSTASITSPSLISTSITGLYAGSYVFRLTVTDDKGATAFDDMTVTVLPALFNSVQAGTDQTIQLPTNSVSLSGTTGNEYGTNTILWTQVSGPSVATFMSPSSLTTAVSNLVIGTYVFALSVTNLENNTSADQVSVTVNAAPNLVPYVSLGNDQSMRLPLNSVNLTSVTSDPDGTIIMYAWTKVSGGTANFTTPSLTSTSITGLSAGSYVFRLTVTDDKGATAFDDIAVTVLPLLLNTAQAGPDQVVQLPINSITLTGTNGNEYGTSAILWTQVSGPSASVIQSPSSLSTIVSNLISGSYIYSIAVTNLENNTSTDQIIVTVNPIASVGKTIQVNVFGGTSPYNNAQWNNWNATNISTNSPVFNYTDGTVSGVYARLSASEKISDNGATYGGTVCPPEVLRFTSYTTTNRTLTLSNLKPNVGYDLYFYTSRLRTDGQKTTFSIGTKQYTVSTDNNKTVAAVITGVFANANSQIVVNIARATGSTYNYLNGFKIVEATLPSSEKGSKMSLLKDESLSELKTDKNIQIEVYPNPFVDRIKIVSSFIRIQKISIYDATGRLVKILINPAEQVIYLPEARNGVYYMVLEANNEIFVKKLVRN